MADSKNTLSILNTGFYSNFPNRNDTDRRHFTGGFLTRTWESLDIGRMGRAFTQHCCCRNQSIFLPPATKLGQGYIFTCVCDSVHRGVCLSACLDTTPPPGPNRYPPDQAPPGPGTTRGPVRYPPDQAPPPRPGTPRHPLRNWKIRSTSGRYASYWNAIFR